MCSIKSTNDKWEIVFQLAGWNQVTLEVSAFLS